MTTTAPERSAKLARWRPKRWEVVYDQIVALSTLGKPHKEIAQLFGYTEQHISNIVNCPEASITRGRLLEQLAKGAISKMDTDFETLAVQAKNRIAQVLYDDELFKDSPFQVVDRGIAVLRGVGRLRSDNEAKLRVDKAIILSGDDAKIIREAIVKSDEARRLHPVEVEAHAIDKPAAD